ncbi:DUF5829 family protein [Streptomyces aureoverticillatus]|uniref:DUF5829 family protein n=1 Tax=Streptomyces aureoverticillatus TaxID=66871 RepID=UPI0013D9D072|nr:DUF5829 family protein [Streptomyces aureoverticillatus]QIB48519.1 hypothetical protein G3H79_02955 [Streptomyces aureoverticillatus]
MLMVLALALTAALLGTVEGGARTARAESGGPHPGRQLLFFNHAYGVLDRETADAVEHSAYLRKFANFQVRTTTGSDGRTWTGRYLLGRETYIELFGVGDVPDSPLGDTGMGVSTERTGDLATARERLRDEGVTDPVDFSQTRDFGDGVPVPWYDGFLTLDAYDSFGAWSMEYRQEYFADPRSNTEPAAYPGDVGRERYLPDTYRERRMRDVTSLHLATSARDVGNTVPLLRAGGFHVRSLADGGAVAKRGGTTIRLDAVASDEAGLRQVTFSLNRPVAHRHEERIGRSTLVVGPGAGAVWTFGEGAAD